jgi:cytochrome c-type biogenesis protein CcmI
MLAEAIAAAILTVLALWLVLYPLLRPQQAAPVPYEPVDPEETPKGVALTALKEIEFDRETGKLSDQDYELLKARYTRDALEALREDPTVSSPGPVSDDVESMIAARLRALRSASASASSDTPVPSGPPQLSCSFCGPRPEADPVFCSTCGRRLPGAATCKSCGANLQPGSRYCDGCGHQVAA